MTTYLIPWLPEKLVVSTEWKTDLQPGADGTEQRICLRSNPTITLDLEYNTVGDEIVATAIQAVRSHLVNDPGARLRIPLRHEAVYLAANMALGSFNVTLDYDTSADWAVAGATVYVEVDENEAGYDALVSHVDHIGGTTSLTVTPGAPAILHKESCRVCPTALVQPTDKQALGTYRVERGTWSLRGTAQEFLGTVGTGVTIATNEEGYLIWDRPASQEESRLVAEEFDGGLDLVGEPYTEGSTLYPKALVRRDLSFHVDGLADWRWFKMFAYSVRGQQVPFLRPTFRDDLSLVEQPVGAGTAILVDDGPDYRPWFADCDTYRRLAFTMSDGTIMVVSVSSIDDNMDGTHTVNLTASYDPGALTIARISFLEATRLASDIVSLSMDRGRQGVLGIQTLVGDFVDQVP